MALEVAGEIEEQAGLAVDLIVQFAVKNAVEGKAEEGDRVLAGDVAPDRQAVAESGNGDSLIGVAQLRAIDEEFELRTTRQDKPGFRQGQSRRKRAF